MAAASGFTGREAISREIIISSGGTVVRCLALIDADCWPTVGVPKHVAGILDSSRAGWDALASSEHLILKFREDGEPYRMVLDGVTGRFVAHQL